ncbi:MAG: MBL fold metallo-hydrolase [Opitutales bacterium]
MQQIPLEDNFSDVIGKAAAGIGLNATALAQRAGLDEIRVLQVLDGKFESGIIASLAKLLNLHAPSLFVLATGAWRPKPVNLNGLALFNTPFPVSGYEEMTVNSYLVWDWHSREAAAFDTGANIEEMRDFIRQKNLRLRSIFLTHAHDDHTHALSDLVEVDRGITVYANELEPVKGARLFKAGNFLSIGGLQVETCLTSGHSPGGTTYVISGLDLPVAIVGDALFSCSQGGIPESYPEAMEKIRREIFSLPEETVVCPGHGPMTTIGEEMEHNPFYASIDS